MYRKNSTHTHTHTHTMVWYSPWFQAPTGDLGMYPMQMRGDFYILNIIITYREHMFYSKDFSLRNHFMSCVAHEKSVFSLLKTAQPDC